MQAVFNSPSLSSIYWRPVQFNVVGDQFNTAYTPILFSNGMSFNVHECFRNYEDLSFNRRTGTFLTNFFNTEKILSEQVFPNYSEASTEIISPLTTPISGHVVSMSLSSSNLPIFIETISKVPGPDDIFTLSFTENNKVSVISHDHRLLTSDSVNAWFQPRISPPDNTQYFNYLLGPETIVLFIQGSNFSRIINNINSTYIPTDISTSPTSAIPSSAVLSFYSYSSINNFNGSIKNSNLVKYVSDPLSVSNSLDINGNPTAYGQNYLGIFPFENPHLNADSAVYDLQIHSLKNYQTPEYEYSFGVNYVEGQNGIRRKYDRIFSGTNQAKGLNNLFLGFKSNTVQYTFKTDQENDFYYPITAPVKTLPTAGLIEDGAIAGGVPYTSDRIYVKMVDYTETLPGLPQPAFITKFSNTWACAWLSGGSQGSAWMDRFYNAAYYTLDQALSAKSIVYNDRLDPTLNYTYDVPSTLSLYPGIEYKYHRVGKKNSESFVSYIDINPSSPMGTKTLHISSWDSNVLVDNSKYLNNGLVFYSDVKNFKNTSLILDGKNHVIFPAKDELLPAYQFTAAVWVKSNDWSQLEGTQIFGNYYNGGYGLVNESSLTAPIFSLVDPISLVCADVNYRFNVTSTKAIPSQPNYSSDDWFVIRQEDFSNWVFSPASRVGYKFDVNGHIINTTSASLSSNLTTISQVEKDGMGNLFIFDKTTRNVVKLDSTGQFIYVNTQATGTTRIELDSSNHLVPAQGNASVIDNNNNLWQVVGSNLYLNGRVYAFVGPTQQISCDSNNNIWIVDNLDKISVLNTTLGTFNFSIRVGKNSTAPVNECISTNRTLDFLRTPLLNQGVCSNSNLYQDIAVLLDRSENRVYLLDNAGNLISKLNLQSLPNGNVTQYQAKGDFTGYHHLRKYTSASKNLSWKLQTIRLDDNTIQAQDLQYDVSSLPSGWHQFVLCFDAINGSINYYIDSILVKSVSITPNTYKMYYAYRSSLLLGVASLGNGTLNDVIGVNDSYKFVGEVADLRIYNKSLLQSETEQLYYSSPLATARRDLNWNIPSGEINYIEEIQHWFQMQLPGSKSKYFNLNIHNFDASPEIKNLVENALRNNIQKISPAHASLYKINWI